MNQWYVKDLSKLTGVTVQTLHHYDRIGLLKPSLRLPNGYRLYSEKDLLKLQQIIALKYFGFELAHIKTLLTGAVDMIENFSAQLHVLEEKAKALSEASQTLKRIISECSDNKSIAWETIIQLIEVYHMTQELEKSWAGKVFSPEELKQYASFEASLKTRFTQAEKEAFEKKWHTLVDQTASNLDQDPTGPIGVELAQKVMNLINSLYGKENANLKHTVWNEGFKKDKMDEHRIDPQIVAWLDKAMDTYYRGRIYHLLDQIEEKPSKDWVTQWNELLEEIYGNAQNLKDELVKEAIKDERVSDAAKRWLKKPW
jgi:DNA-binding transcriptional MerR regulator